MFFEAGRPGENIVEENCLLRNIPSRQGYSPAQVLAPFLEVKGLLLTSPGSPEETEDRDPMSRFELPHDQLDRIG